MRRIVEIQLRIAGRNSTSSQPIQSNAFVQAMQRQAEDLERTAEDLRRMLAEVRHPTLTAEQVAAAGHRFAQAGQVEVARMVHDEFRRVLAWLLAALVAALVVGFGAGWWTGRTGRTVLGEQQCQTQADRSKLCWVPVAHRS